MSRNSGPCIMRFVKVNKPVYSTGLRATFYYPNGGSYSGYWNKNEHHMFGIKAGPAKTEKQLLDKKPVRGPLIYKGKWKNGNRTGFGSILRRQGPALRLVYAGQWKNNMKCGEGKQIYDNGSVYFGYWAENRRHGLGIEWYVDGRVYLGEWRVDVRHGLGVMFYPNGNRYEGHFARGYKNGEGVFYHNNTGHIQKGMWEDDTAKVSIMQDWRRNQPKLAAPYPIPVSHLRDPNYLIRRLFQIYKPNGEKPQRYFAEPICLQFNHKFRHLATFEERFSSTGQLDLYTDIKTDSCTCKKPDKLYILGSKD